MHDSTFALVYHPVRGAARLTRHLSQRNNLLNEPLSHREPFLLGTKSAPMPLEGRSTRESEYVT